MYYFLLALLILDSLLLTVVILLQAGQGGGLASLGGGTADRVLGGRQATTLLTKASWVLGSGLLVISLLLSIVSSTRTSGLSEVQRQLQTTPQAVPTAPLPGEPGGAAPTQAPPPPAPNP